MAERYTRLYTLPGSQYTQGSPVIIDAAALLKDNSSDSVIAQCKFKNIDNKKILGLKIKLFMKDLAGRDLGVVEHQYLDIEAKRDDEFGSRTPINGLNFQARSIDVIVTEVIFDDQSIWTTDCEKTWNQLETQTQLTDIYKRSEAIDQYRLLTSKKAIAKPMKTEGIWFCVCGAINQNHEETCHICQSDLISLLSVTDEQVSANTENYLWACYDKAVVLMDKATDISSYEKAIKEFEKINFKDCQTLIKRCKNEIVKLKKQEEKAKEEEKAIETKKLEEAKKRSLRVIGIVASIGVVIAVAITLIIKVIIPNNNYNSAIALMEAGHYEDAIAAFEAMDGYKDSDEQIKTCQNAILDNMYNQAVSYIDNGSYIEAYVLLSELNDYKDSSDLLNSIHKEYEKAFRSIAEVGDAITFGSYEQDNNTGNGKEEIEWIVLDKQEGRLLVISKYALDAQKFNTSNTRVTWDSCSLRRWLNGDFLNEAFDDEEKELIIVSSVSADEYGFYGNKPVFPGNDTKDSVFLLSCVEAEKYFSDESERECFPTQYAKAHGAKTQSYGTCIWWLRSPGAYEESSAANIVWRGGIGTGSYVDVVLGIRPLVWISLD